MRLAAATAELDAAIAVRSAEASKRAGAQTAGAEELSGLQAEVAQLEASVAQVQAQAAKGGDAPATSARSQDRLAEEHASLSRTLNAVLRRNGKLGEMLAELGEPARLAKKQELVAQKADERDEMLTEVKNLERALKKTEQQLSIAAAVREREADVATSQNRQLQAEVNRVMKLCSAAEDETRAVQQQLDVANSELAIGARLTGRLSEAFRSRGDELFRGEPLPAYPPPSSATKGPHVDDPAIAGGASAADGAAGAAVDVAARLLETSGEELVVELLNLVRKHARITAELRRRQLAVEEESVADLKTRLKTRVLVESLEPAAGPPREVRQAFAQAQL
ncbi:hypothetical protein T492DRAFT_919136 [Pavlovales sp. CCMP2436]|nr:hypothetical protein T492DRAFT_919136 [Pavlovales sp. CCMP2436]